MINDKLLWKLLDYCAEDQNRGIVCLIGPTGGGKTHQVNRWATSQGRAVVPGDISVTDEVELGGYPLKSKNGQEVTYSLPPFIMTQLRAKNITTDNFVVFLDEMDKPRFQQLVCLLSLLDPKQRRLRQYVLPKAATIVCAMNEPLSDLPETIVSRLLFVPWPMQKSYFDDVPSHLVSLIKETSPFGEISFPHKPKSPRNSFQLNYWFGVNEFWENKTLREFVVRGLYPFESVPLVMKWLEGYEEPTDIERWIKEARPGAIVDNLVQVLNKASGEQKEIILRGLEERADKDETGEIERIWKTFVTVPTVALGLGAADPLLIQAGIDALREGVRKLAKAENKK